MLFSTFFLLFELDLGLKKLVFFNMILFLAADLCQFNLEPIWKLKPCYEKNKTKQNKQIL